MLTLTALSIALLGAAIEPPPFRMQMDHDVVLDANGRLQPWTTYRHVIVGSMTYIEKCPTVKTRFGDDPWFLVTSRLNEDGTFMRNQNNQGSNVYYAVETLQRYLPYSGDKNAIAPVRLLLDRVRKSNTPEKWAWPNVPRTQDDTPDGNYSDNYTEPDKMCMVGIGYLRFAQLTGETEWVDAAKAIAKTVAAHIVPGDATHSPVPFRVKLKKGDILDDYSADMVFCVIFFEEMAKLDIPEAASYKALRDTLWQWVLDYPVKNNQWSGYYEDVKSNHENLNQHLPLETARYMLEHFDDNPAYATIIPQLIDWVRERFGETKRWGATSIREQDGCFDEMSSHTARYASVVAGWWAECEKRGLLDPEKRAALHEEARASFALCTYSTWNRYSKGDCAMNYVGLGYTWPWFSDSYFDFLPHLLDGLKFMPDMEPSGTK